MYGAVGTGSTLKAYVLLSLVFYRHKDLVVVDIRGRGRAAAPSIPNQLLFTCTCFRVVQTLVDVMCGLLCGVFRQVDGGVQGWGREFKGRRAGSGSLGITFALV